MQLRRLPKVFPSRAVLATGITNGQMVTHHLIYIFGCPEQFQDPNTFSVKTMMMMVVMAMMTMMMAMGERISSAIYPGDLYPNRAILRQPPSRL